MSVLNLAIGKSKYTINCEDGEEENVIGLAAKLNERVNNLSLAMRAADEKTILMLCALSIQDELESAKNNQPTATDSAKIVNQNIDNAVQERVVEELREITNGVLKLVKKIENL